MRLDVTIIVCTRNRAEMLRTALRSLIGLAAEGFAFEVLVIDNGSTDPTPQVVEEVALLAPVRVRCVREPRSGVVHARNRGIAEAAGEWLAFFDDDQIADPRWLAELLAAAHERGAKCVGGSVVLSLPLGCARPLAAFTRVLLGETVGQTEPRAYDRQFTPGTGNMMLHRDVFAQIGLFDEAFQQGGEDTDLFLRLHAAGLPAWFAPAAVIHHVIPPERLEPGHLERVAERIGGRLAGFEHRHYGGWLYPLMYAARLGQLLAVVLPRRAFAALGSDAEALVASRCRLAFQQSYAVAGWALCFRGPESSPPPKRLASAHAPQAEPAAAETLVENRA